MAGSRVPRPQGLDQDSTDLNDGTTIRALSPIPGSISTVMRSQLHLPRAEGPELAKLFAAVTLTKVGKKFLKIAGHQEPKLVWGNTGKFHGHFDGDTTITLNELERNELSDCEWKQVIAMELGNFANREPLNLVYDDGEKGSLSKEEFVDAIEKIEFNSRNAVVDAHSKGEFSSPGEVCLLIFPGGKLKFKEWIKAPEMVEHQLTYEDKWEEDCKKNYLKKHPK